MSRSILLTVLILVVCATAVQAAEPSKDNAAPPGPPKPQYVAVAGMIRGGAKVEQSLGHQGCLVIRSSARWDVIRNHLVAAGWQPKAADALPGVDFQGQAIVFLFDSGDEGSVFSVRRFVGGEKPELDVVMSYRSYETIANTFNFLLVAVPKSKELTVAVSTYWPGSDTPYATPDKARLEWKAAFGPDAGDIVDGLQGTIRAKNQTVKVGDDTLVEFTLKHIDPAVVKDGVFAKVFHQPPAVWDGKYSKGYRNHSFEIRTPDGSGLLLQPKVISNWDKNAPHPVDITAEKPYVLPEWMEGETFKSLKNLGLDAAKPGTYTITGIYSELGGQTERQGKPVTLWSGTMASNTITVEVRGQALRQ